MEDDPKFSRDEPSVETTVLPHPDKGEPLEREVTVQTDSVTPPPPTTKQPETPHKPCKEFTCPMDAALWDLPPLVPPHAFTIDVRDLSATLIGTFAMGAAVAFALAYFSRTRVINDA